MKILVDENIPRATAALLREEGHDVADVRGTADQGLIDAELWKMAQQEGRLVITTDKGFSQYRREAHHGILIVRLRQPNRNRIHESVMRAIRDFQGQAWHGMLVVMRDRARSVSRTPREETEHDG